jgi:hypothetical protein
VLPHSDRTNDGFQARASAKSCESPAIAWDASCRTFLSCTRLSGCRAASRTASSAPPRLDHDGLTAWPNVFQHRQILPGTQTGQGAVKMLIAAVTASVVESHDRPNSLDGLSGSRREKARQVKTGANR